MPAIAYSANPDRSIQYFLFRKSSEQHQSLTFVLEYSNDLLDWTAIPEANQSWREEEIDQSDDPRIHIDVSQAQTFRFFRLGAFDE